MDPIDEPDHDGSALPVLQASSTGKGQARPTLTDTALRPGLIGLGFGGPGVEREINLLVRKIISENKRMPPKARFKGSLYESGSARS
jgi:hypothetical protein